MRERRSNRWGSHSIPPTLDRALDGEFDIFSLEVSASEANIERLDAAVAAAKAAQRLGVSQAEVSQIKKDAVAKAIEILVTANVIRRVEE